MRKWIAHAAAGLGSNGWRPEHMIRRRSTVTFSKLGSWGQFGNQLFQIAAVLGYANRHACHPALPGWYCTLNQIDFSTLFPKTKPLIRRVKGQLYREPSFAYADIPFIFNADLRGNFQSEKYFQNIKQEIRSLYSEPDAIRNQLDSFCREKGGLQDFSAVHIRCYKHPEKDAGRGPVEMLPEAYFIEALARLAVNPPVLVATDNKALVSSLLDRHSMADSVQMLQFEDPLLDFYMLSRASRIAMSNSSFSWWAAYLGREKQEVIAPHRYYWFNAEVRRDPFWDTRDLYPANFRELIL